MAEEKLIMEAFGGGMRDEVVAIAMVIQIVFMGYPAYVYSQWILSPFVWRYQLYLRSALTVIVPFYISVILLGYLIWHQNTEQSRRPGLLPKEN
jgi:surface polysaccharide O-acyltransferase-like enzyme